MSEPDSVNNEHTQTTAEIEPEAGIERIAHVYAQTLLNVAEKAGKAPAVLEEFGSLIDDILTPFPKLEETLASRSISHDKKSGIIDRVFGEQGSPLVVNFLKVVSRHGRLDCLRAIRRQARLLDDKRRGRVPVTLTTATPLDDRQTLRITEALRNKLGGEPVLTRVTDPDLIGGVVVRVGDVVYDGSIANQLKTIRKQMNDKSAHEIQSERDRFYHSTGD